MRFRSHEDAIKAGIGYVSEDRLTLGLVQQQSVADNMVLPILDKLQNRFHIIDEYRKNKLILQWIQQLGVRVADPNLRSLPCPGVTSKRSYSRNGC